MGGRAAEEIVFGDVTTGAENDIQRATQMARRMVTQWGMSEKLGTVAIGHKEELVFLGRDLGEQRNYSEEVAAADRRGGPQPHQPWLRDGERNPLRARAARWTRSSSS